MPSSLFEPLETPFICYFWYCHSRCALVTVPSITYRSHTRVSITVLQWHKMLDNCIFAWSTTLTQYLPSTVLQNLLKSVNPLGVPIKCNILNQPVSDNDWSSPCRMEVLASSVLHAAAEDSPDANKIPSTPIPFSRGTCWPSWQFYIRRLIKNKVQNGPISHSRSHVLIW